MDSTAYGQDTDKVAIFRVGFNFDGYTGYWIAVTCPLLL